ncbi:MAG: helix-turn-helix domain-containing protein, partial [Actinomycetota bacterium]
MDREELEGYLAQGFSLERIGRVLGRDASTVSYWLRKFGLRAVHAERAAPKGGIAQEDLERLLARGMSMRQIAQELGLSQATVRHWMKKYGLTSRRSQRLAETARARAADKAPLQLTCLR